ncbi:cytochrome P450 [Motilibacter deserti]|uniref:Cytochrome P450 n=1 Tax=Motilibacter deserti TaxID=2714956 RepID=A0ABX0H337_9ACTN|nr:cytochrome P450 [Motilibacter deserti]NHC16365.1 cytochrome P450 [Motilibacter deserti]
MTDRAATGGATSTVDELLAHLATPAGRADPYPAYAALREAGPVVRGQDGRVAVLSYADCLSVVRDSRFAHHTQESMGEALGPEWKAHLGLRQMFGSLLTLNPPDHTRLRGLVAGAFTARRVQALRPAVEAQVQALLDAMEDQAVDGDVDFVDAFAFPLPVNVIGELLGVPTADRPQFRAWVRDATQVLEVLTPRVVVKADIAARRIRDQLEALVVERRRRPADDLLTALVQAEQEGVRLSEDELLTTAALLFSAGFETTVGLLGNGLAALDAHPGERARLLADPALTGPAVEELLRYDSPVQTVRRTVAADVEIGGVTVGPGTQVTAYVGAANRDPARFDLPDRLLLDRPGNAPLSFGGGIHFCLGAALARLEAQVAFPALLRRFPGLRVVGPVARRDSLTLRNLTSMRVRLAG